jgi:hypothetical protein
MTITVGLKFDCAPGVDPAQVMHLVATRYGLFDRSGSNLAADIRLETALDATYRGVEVTESEGPVE